MYNGPFRWWVQSVMPVVFDDSLSYYEVLAKLTKYIEGLTGDVEQIEKILETIEGIEDVTQFTEMLESIKNEIGDLSNLSTQSKTDLVNAINEVALKASQAYVKPSDGIPESDLSAGVQDKLNKTASATEYIINNVKLKASPSNNSPSDLGLGTYSVPAGGIPWDTLSQDVQNRINAGGGGTGGTTDYTELNNKPEINGHTLNAGNNTYESLGIGTYDKPTTGIPESDLSVEVQNKLNTSGGIADSENSFVATRDYEAGELIYINGVLYKTNYKILSGTNLIPGNNIQTTDISAEIERINNEIDSMASGEGLDSWSLVHNITIEASDNTLHNFFEYVNLTGGESYLFIITPTIQGGAYDRGYIIRCLKRDGTVVETEEVSGASNYENQYRFTFTPDDTGEYYFTVSLYPGGLLSNGAKLKIELEYTQSQGISELWTQVNKATQLEPRVDAIETLSEQHTGQIDNIENAMNNGTLFSEKMGVGETNVVNKKKVIVYKNHVETIGSEGTNDTNRKCCPLFSTPEILPVLWSDLDLSDYEFININFDTNAVNLRMTVEWENIYPNGPKNQIMLGTKNNETGVITKYGITGDVTTSKYISLFEQCPLVKENGNFLLFIVFRESAYPNSFNYWITPELIESDDIGELSELKTDNKESIVDAINEIYDDVENIAHIDNGTLFSDAMGVGETNFNARKKFIINKNHVKTIGDGEGSSSTYRYCNLFGTPIVTSDSWSELDLTDYDFIDITFDTEKVDLMLSVEWKYIYGNAAYNQIMCATKNRDTNEITKYALFGDRYNSQHISLFEYAPMVKENGNFILFACMRNSAYPNEFNYWITPIMKNSRNNIESIYKGKKLSILGDSLCTFAGYIPEGNYAYYPSGTVQAVTDTWWDKLMRALGMTLLINNSWGGSRVTTTKPANPNRGEDGIIDSGCWSRCENLGEDPDVIIVSMGTNDFDHEVELGTWDGRTAVPSDKNLDDTPSDATKTFREAYAIMLNKILTKYPRAEVWCATFTPVEASGAEGFPEINGNGVPMSDFNEAIEDLANIFGARVIHNHQCGLTYQNMVIYNPQKLHYNKYGHSLVANNAIREMDNAVKTRYAIS